jgi:predicted deacylase
VITIDLAHEGKHVGVIVVEGGGGTPGFETPIVSIRNGDGPRVLCLAGVHGDEPDGQLVASELARSVDQDQIRGQLIILPAANMPAAVAGSRKSPLDGGDLNRSFPGDPNGTPTQRLAHLIETTLVPGSDLVIDLHSGGIPSVWLSGPIIIETDDPEEMAWRVALLEAFGAPHGYVFTQAASGSTGTPGACDRHGMCRLGTEVGGGGVLSLADVELLRSGVLRVLVKLGLLKSASMAPEAMGGTRLLWRGGEPKFRIAAPETGFFAPVIELGDIVQQGEPLGRMVWPETPLRAPEVVNAGMTGVLIARRAPGRADKGDNLAILAVPYGQPA